MGESAKTMYNPDEPMIQEAMKKGYQKGWDARKEYDASLIDETAKQTRNLRDFLLALREKFGVSPEVEQ